MAKFFYLLSEISSFGSTGELSERSTIKYIDCYKKNLSERHVREIEYQNQIN